MFHVIIKSGGHRSNNMCETSYPVWPKFGDAGAELLASLTRTFSTIMAHIAAVDLALEIRRQLFPIAKDDADFNSALSFMAALPSDGSRQMDTHLVRETLALLILKEMSAADNKDDFNTIFGRIDFLIPFSSGEEENLFRSRLLNGFFKVCKELNLETFASANQIEALKRGHRRPKRAGGQFHLSETLVGHDIEEWMAWLLDETDVQEGELVDTDVQEGE